MKTEAVGPKVTLVGTENRDVETVLRSGGITPTVVPIDRLNSLAQPSAPQPDVVVLDLRTLPVVPHGLTLLKRQHPATPVVIVAKSLDPDLMLSAMRAGANECVAEPLTLQDLEAAISRVVMKHEPTPAASQSFAFVGVKGGVGATSLAVNVSTALARVATAEALLIDLHVARGDAALYLGVEPRFSVADALDNIHKLDDAFFRSLVTRTPSRLDLLAAPPAGGPARLDCARVRSLLEFTSKHFEFTVVDVPRTEPGALESLGSMKAIVVVTTQELPAVRSAAAMTHRLREQYGDERVIVVVNRLDRQSDISYEDVERALGVPVTHAFPSEYRVTLRALNKGRPVVLDNHSRLAAAFEHFSRELVGLKVDKKRPGKTGHEPAGWLTRLTGRKA